MASTSALSVIGLLLSLAALVLTAREVELPRLGLVRWGCTVLTGLLVAASLVGAVRPWALALSCIGFLVSLQATALRFGVLKPLRAYLERGTPEGDPGCELPVMVETGATVADAAAEWLRWAEHERDCKPSTLADYRSTSRLIVRDLGGLRLEDVTSQLLERWKTTIPGSNRNVQKRLVVLHGIFRRAMRVWGLPRNPVADVVLAASYRVGRELAEVRRAGSPVAATLD